MSDTTPPKYVVISDSRVLVSNSTVSLGEWTYNRYQIIATGKYPDMVTLAKQLNGEE